MSNTVKEYYESNDGGTTDATIAHYGVKGMRWGVRRQKALATRSRYVVKEGQRQRGQIKSALKTTGKYALGKTEIQKSLMDRDAAAVKSQAKTHAKRIGSATKTAGKYAVGQTKSQKEMRRLDSEVVKATRADVKEAVSGIKSKVGKKVRGKLSERQAQIAKDYKQYADEHRAEQKKSAAKLSQLKKESDAHYRTSQKKGKEYIKEFERAGTGKETPKAKQLRKEGSEAQKKARSAAKSWIKEKENHDFMKETADVLDWAAKDAQRDSIRNKKKSQ